MGETGPGAEDRGGPKDLRPHKVGARRSYKRDKPGEKGRRREEVLGERRERRPRSVISKWWIDILLMTIMSRISKRNDNALRVQQVSPCRTVGQSFLAASVSPAVFLLIWWQGENFSQSAESRRI